MPTNPAEYININLNDSSLIGQIVTINKSDFSQVKGKVIKVSNQKINIDLSMSIKGFETNVWITVIDSKGNEHLGTIVS